MEQHANHGHATFPPQVVISGVRAFVGVQAMVRLGDR